MSEPTTTQADPPPASRTAAARGVEIRVHGIGDHDRFSALGEPHFTELENSQVWIGEPPPVPRGHGLLLINWSRANRRLTRNAAWYLAFPFTLANVAGYMESPQGSRLHRRLVEFAGAVLVVSMAAWINVIVETAWHQITPTPVDPRSRVILAIIGPSVLAILIARRAWRTQKWVCVLNLAALAGVAVLTYLEPGEWIHKHGHSWVRGPDNAVDPMTPLVAVTSGVVILIAFVMLALAWRKRRRTTEPETLDSADIGVNYVGAALLLVSAVTLLHTAGSILRLTVATALRFIRIAHESNGAPAGGSGTFLLLPKPDDLGQALRIDLIPLFFLAMALIFVVDVIRVYRRSVHHLQQEDKAGLSETNPRCRRPEAISHYLSSHVGEILPRLALTTLVLTVVTWVLLTWPFSGGRVLPVISATLVILQTTGVCIVAAIVARRPERLTSRITAVFGGIADIAGFWPPRFLPLAGASYREALAKGISDAIARNPTSPTVLVGHSQGSVICAWYLLHRRPHDEVALLPEGLRSEKLHETMSANENSNPIMLVTCGSPLKSLYETFFPRYFSADTFSRIGEASAAPWVNLWRETDPIATPIPSAVNIDVTERCSDPLRGHGEYWREPAMRRRIGEFLNQRNACPPYGSRTSKSD